jgi:hypothetical protein
MFIQKAPCNDAGALLFLYIATNFGMPIGDWLFIYIRSHRHTDGGKVVYYLLEDEDEQG